MNTAEKLCLQWNDFKVNVSSSFGKLREDTELTDVTLACEDGSQVEAHKVILAASSPFFMDILRRNRVEVHKMDQHFHETYTRWKIMSICKFTFFYQC